MSCTSRHAYGRAAATAALLAWVDAHETYHIETGREFFAGDEGYYEWRFTAKRTTGEPVEIHGVDYVRFADAKIVEKNSFIKEYVDDIERIVEELTAAGVEFTRYDDIEHDANGITARAGGGRIAWFQDPDGNTFAVEADA